MEIDYPVAWEENKFGRRRLIFLDIYNYQVHEQPFVGVPTILNVKIVGQENGWSKLRLETNAGFRELFCKVVDLIET